MDNKEEESRRMRDECDQGEDIKATVGMAQAFIEMGMMSEAEALKYFNLPKVIYERFRTPQTGKS